MKDAFTTVFRPDALAKSLGISLLDFMRLTSKDSGLQLVQITGQEHLLHECRQQPHDDVLLMPVDERRDVSRLEEISFQEGSPLKSKASITREADDMEDCDDDQQQEGRRVTDAGPGDAGEGVDTRPEMESISIQNEDSNDSAMSGSSDRRDESEAEGVEQQEMRDRQQEVREGEDGGERQQEEDTRKGCERQATDEDSSGEQTTKEDVTPDPMR